MDTLTLIKEEIDRLASKLEETDALDDKERLISLLDRLYYLHERMKRDSTFGGGSPNVPTE